MALAWLLTRTDVPMAPLWRVLAPLPLVFPSFIGAAAFIAGLGPDGILRHALEFVGYHPPRRFRNSPCLLRANSGRPALFDYTKARRGR